MVIIIIVYACACKQKLDICHLQIYTFRNWGSSSVSIDNCFQPQQHIRVTRAGGSNSSEATIRKKLGNADLLLSVTEVEAYETYPICMSYNKIRVNTCRILYHTRVAQRQVTPSVALSSYRMRTKCYEGSSLAMRLQLYKVLHQVQSLVQICP